MIHKFAQRLANWQKQHGRHGLPWQHKGAYETWISEIMLQQTQVQWSFRTSKNSYKISRPLLVSQTPHWILFCLIGRALDIIPGPGICTKLPT